MRAKWDWASPYARAGKSRTQRKTVKKATTRKRGGHSLGLLSLEHVTVVLVREGVLGLASVGEDVEMRR